MERQRIVVDVDDVVDLEGVAPSCTSLQGTALTSQTSPNTQCTQWTDRDSNSNSRIANAVYSLCTISPTLNTQHAPTESDRVLETWKLVGHHDLTRKSLRPRGGSHSPQTVDSGSASLDAYAGVASSP
jgi:hypothetical protein